MPAAPSLTAKQRDDLLRTLHDRFEKHPKRHPKLKWSDVEKRLTAKGAKLATLLAMEDSGGEPDVVGTDPKTGACIFMDCAAQSPKGRRSVCFDEKARKGRKEHPPKDSAEAMAERMGAELLTEEEYRALQAVGPFDTTTSSWIATPAKIRALGGALFCDHRFDTTFTYHNGAESYYAARGVRCSVRV